MTTTDPLLAYTPSFEDVFQMIFGEAFELLIERQKKYGPDNIERLGEYGVLSRLAHDKVERVMRAFNGRIVRGQVLLDDPTDYEDDTYEDGLFDIANYALIAIAKHRGLWGAPLSDT
jgi:hypothetical protein